MRIVTSLTTCAIIALAGTALASSHREAPFLTKNPKVDGTDVYFFRSYEPGRSSFVTFIANYLPLQDPGGGPNFFALDPEALYELHLDNDGDGTEDLTFQFRFKNELNNGGAGIALPIGPSDGGAKENVSVAFANVGNPADRSKLSVLETYSVTLVRGDRRSGRAEPIRAPDGSTTFIKPFDYAGRKSFGNADGGDGNYEAYANGFIQTVNIPGCSTPARMFVGQRQEGFAVNIGPIFDLVNAPAAVITDPSKRGAVRNALYNKNITSLALELPIACVTSGTQTIVGAWSTASVRQARVINPAATYDRPSREGGAWTQVSRLGMPLVNEVVIGIKDKDRFNSSHPKDDAQFLPYVTNPTLPAILELLFETPAPTLFPRGDLVAAFLTGVPGVNANGSTCEYQRLNTALPATPAGRQNNLGAAACFVNGVLTLTNPGCDPAGFPNGRRPGDDVVDIELRVSMGYLLGNNVDAPSRNVPFHDAVLQCDNQFDNAFPYLKTPLPGAKGDGS
ncbi:MAG: DUF4331 domain-containing protein [Archangium sp.]|nr:DUF4331 domain-containing protein [Archangium sp.]MDP3157534.1 DUF4331 domain-containing protein [Archangium sp.]MDP3574298.1 DUF4331 domain-containing protein [Archangium sp.]